jgi:hypothetical protein
LAADYSMDAVGRGGKHIMSTMKLGVAACTLATACLLATPASAGLASPSAQATRADPGPIPSGEVEAAQVAPAEVAAARLLRIAPRNARPFGRSYREWVAAWWRWAAQTRASGHPLLSAAADCSTGQRGRVWFLGGDFVGAGRPIERDCTVPAGTALFVALTTESWLSTPEVACITADPWYRATPRDEEYALFEEQILDPIERPRRIRALSLTLDGRSAGDLRGFFVRSTIFTARLPQDSIYDALGFCPQDIPPLLTAPDVAWGFHVFLQPLPAGEYTLRWKADVDHIDVSPNRQRQDVTYHLTVKEGGPPS